jgi:Transcriptional regulator, AbiEi antitoxin
MDALVPGMREEMRSHAGLAERAAGQYGVVSHRQLLELGFSPSAVGRLASCGRLHRVHRGVYAVGHPALTRHGGCMAAILACGDRAVLSHRSAGWLWGLTPGYSALVEITVPTRGRQRAGVRVHHAPALDEDDCTVEERLPTTTLARTLLDLAATCPLKRLEGIVERADRVGMLDLIDIDSTLARSPGRPGSPRLQQALDLYREPIFARAPTERRFLALVLDAGLPRPAINTFVAGVEVDAYWERERFAVELDGWDTHRTRAAFERDPLRLEELKLVGIDSTRLTARRIEREPGRVGQRLRQLLANRRRELGL